MGVDQGQARMRIMVVRHGQAVPKKGWTGADVDRPLVARGRRQAERLSEVIGASRPVRVVSSPALRCAQTVQPFADNLGVAVETSTQLSPDAHQAATDLCRQLVASEVDDSTVVLCTHREVLVELLPQLSHELNRKLAHRPPGAKGGAWILRYRQRQLAEIDYRPPAA
jgi:8-oxo-(d)GTP phosphatase